MQNYAPGSAVSVTFSLQNEAGQTLEPTALRWRVLDENDVVLVDWTPLAPPVPYQDTLELAIEPAATGLATGETRGLRSIELEVTTTAGSVTLSEQILIQAITILRVGVNSFSTYGRAILTAETFTEQTVAGWHRETRREERERALEEAHDAIMRMPLFVRGRPMREVIELGGYETLDDRLKGALRRAQMLEASEILNADPTMMARRNGLLSMTVGESSQYFGTAKPFETPVMSRQAIRALSPWISYSLRIGRA